jgi:hypothetical protein
MISHSGRRRKAAAASTASTTRAATSSSAAQHVDHDYEALLLSCRRAFHSATHNNDRLFTTDADDTGNLWNLYLKNLPEHERQFHDCRCCRRFIERFGGAVVIDEGGHTTPAMWVPDALGIYAKSFSSMFHAVKSARVTGVFLCKDFVWGTPETPGWTHLAVTPPASLVYREGLMTAGQATAAKKQDFITVSTALLTEFSASALDQVLRLLESDALARSEKFVGPVRWLRALHDRPKGRLGVNLLWRAIASAPEGYCHPKSSVIGPLLDDIRAGKSTEEIQRAFESMMHPLRYQRPQAAPRAQSIQRAEEAVEKLGIARSLERRFARLDEVQKAWTPRAVAELSGTGVFSHLKPRVGPMAVNPVVLPESTVTAEKFLSKVLPLAERVEVYCPPHGDYTGILTAEHADAPGILKWGNSFSWYVYHGGSSALQWNLVPGWNQVAALVRKPSMWGDGLLEQWGDGYVLVLPRAVDARKGQGNALFPEMLRSDLHGARAVIEAYSRTAEIGRHSDQAACGLWLDKSTKNLRLRVLANGGWSPYLVDRWD